MRSPSSPDRTAAGSTARSCAPTAASSDPATPLHASPRRRFVMSKKIILITGASSGFGRLTAEALARAGHTVYASMRDVAGRNAKNAAAMAAIEGADLRPIELDVQSDASAKAAVERIIAESGRIDVLLHNA